MLGPVDFGRYQELLLYHRHPSDTHALSVMLLSFPAASCVPMLDDENKTMQVTWEEVRGYMFVMPTQHKSKLLAAFHKVIRSRLS